MFGAFHVSKHSVRFSRASLAICKNSRISTYHEILNVSYRTYLNNIVLHVNDSAIISKVEDDAVQRSNNSNYQVANNVTFAFPPEAVTILSHDYNCPICDQSFPVKKENEGMPTIECQSCKKEIKSGKFQILYNIELTFINEGGMSDVKLYRFDVESYFSNRKMSVPRIASEVVITMLDDESSSILCNERNRCIGIQA